MKDTLFTIGAGAAGITATEVADTVTHSVAQVTDFGQIIHVLVQIAIGVATLIGLFRKKKTSLNDAAKIIVVLFVSSVVMASCSKQTDSYSTAPAPSARIAAPVYSIQYSIKSPGDIGFLYLVTKRADTTIATVPCTINFTDVNNIAQTVTPALLFSHSRPYRDNKGVWKTETDTTATYSFFGVDGKYQTTVYPVKDGSYITINDSKQYKVNLPNTLIQTY